MAGGSWSDEELLRYVCRVFVSSTAQRLLKGIAANKIERFCSVVDFVDFHCVIRTVAARQQPLERMAFNRLAGLGSWRTSSNRQVLENVCITIHNLREPLMAALQNFPETEALPFAEALLIAEAVSHRAGYHTELDETPFTAIERWAKDLTTRVAKDTLADIVSCVAVPAAS